MTTATAGQADEDLPYVFDLIWDLKTKQELLKALESPGCDPDMVEYAIEYGYVSQGLQGASLTAAEKATIAKLRARGFAVVVLSPEGLGAEDPRRVEESMVSYAIDAFGVALDQEEDEKEEN